MESLSLYIDDLHSKEERAFIAGNQEAMNLIGAELDEVVTDEALGIMKGDK